MTHPLVQKLYAFGCMTAGCLLIALSFNMLQHPNQIASGGAPGLSLLLQHYTGLPPAYLLWGINVLMLAVSWAAFGRTFAWRSAYGALLLPLLVYLTDSTPALTANPLMASVYGGVGTGLGLGLVFRTRGSIGGLSVAAHLLQRAFGIPLAAGIAWIDFAIVAAGAAAFSAENALYALAGLYCIRKLVPMTQGLDRNRFAMIVTAQPELVRNAVLQQLDRGLTELTGKGGYTGTEKSVLMVVLRQQEARKLRRLLNEADPSAFMWIGDTEEVMGDGFDRFETASPKSMHALLAQQATW